MSIRLARGVAVALLIALLHAASAAQAPQTPAPYTVVSRDGRRPLPARVFNGQEMFAVEDLARLFTLTVREDAIAGGLTITVRGQSILLSPNQEIASVAGRLVSLPAPPAREGSAWFVPVDFISRALAPVAGTPMELRKPSRLVIVGDVRMPRVAGRIEPLGALARLTFDVAPTTPHTVTQEANRLLLRFEADALDASLPASSAPELISAVRPEGPAAIAIELGPRFASFRASDLPGDRGGLRIVIEVIAKTTEGAAPPPPTPAPADAPPLLDIVPAGTLRTVVIDPGHGGAEPGARGPSGNVEKTVTMETARRLKAALEGRLGVRVILTRDRDTAVGLDERAAVANNNKADLFISLHANASVRPSVTGAEVFYLSLEDYGDDARRAASASRAALPVFGGGVRDIEVVPWMMAQARHIERSGAFARTVEAALRGRVTMSPRALMQAPFRVLVGANMPAVLVEMGFITNPAQETQLASDAYQNEIVQAMVDAVIQFRDSRGAPVPSAPGDRQ
ncbi:MAG TPA: N-acetylmuramoyl-L-alanine amidase [Vicinamibacterales bacterium]|nr:N-acetylmuramoyl-L-alanine amidase [Vicinamibacterales bacterium]